MKGQSLIVIAVIVCLVTMNSAEPSPEILHKGAEVAQIIMEMAKTSSVFINFLLEEIANNAFPKSSADRPIYNRFLIIHYVYHFAS